MLALPAVSHVLTRGLESTRETDITGAQAILILGGDLDRDGNGDTIPGPLSLERLRDAAALARSTGLPIAVTGGPLWRDGPAVGAVMATSLQRDFATPVRWVETRSADTWENARDSAALLGPLGIRRVLLVTQAWHMPRAVLAFARTDLAVLPAPVGRLGAPTGFGLNDVIPSARAWHYSYYALHEWVGLAAYHLRVIFGQ